MLHLIYKGSIGEVRSAFYSQECGSQISEVCRVNTEFLYNTITDIHDSSHCQEQNL